MDLASVGLFETGSMFTLLSITRTFQNRIMLVPIKHVKVTIMCNYAIYSWEAN